MPIGLYQILCKIWVYKLEHKHAITSMLVLNDYVTNPIGSFPAPHLPLIHLFIKPFVGPDLII